MFPDSERSTIEFRFSAVFSFHFTCLSHEKCFFSYVLNSQTFSLEAIAAIAIAIAIAIYLDIIATIFTHAGPWSFRSLLLLRFQRCLQLPQRDVRPVHGRERDHLHVHVIRHPLLPAQPPNGRPDEEGAGPGGREGEAAYLRGQGEGERDRPTLALLPRSGAPLHFQLPYLEAFLCELQRHATLAPTAIHHTPTTDIHFRGFTYKKNTPISSCLVSACWRISVVVDVQLKLFTFPFSARSSATRRTSPIPIDSTRSDSLTRGPASS